ncbi:MAG: SDR family oxidoreductase [Sulfobacillus sp.]|nr:SDR family oxidoreductase [Sulfobacillus sp.]
MSIIGLLGNAGRANYAATKAGLIGLTLALAQEYAANAVVPGIIDTPMSRVVASRVVDRKFEAILLSSGHPGRGGTSHHPVSKNPYINGTVLRVDGGIRF